MLAADLQLDTRIVVRRTGHETETSWERFCEDNFDLTPYGLSRIAAAIGSGATWRAEWSVRLAGRSA
jgi:hypothetical protein